MNVIAIFDIGKTNKKVFLFDENYQIVWEESIVFLETVDEDGFLCENIEELKKLVFSRLTEIKELREYVLKAVNFSTYGASFVYLNEKENVLTPLYNYLKPYPKILEKNFYKKYGGKKDFTLSTSSPALGNLNSGMQIIRLKYKKPDLFSDIKYCLHLPQYLSFLLTGKCFTDVTSIGCHTHLWDYSKMNYHDWVIKEDIAEKLPPIICADDVIKPVNGIVKDIAVGVGLHDSSSAIIPYIINFKEPFVLLSTGTWIIAMNPFNNNPLTSEELENDCLCFLQFEGKPVKAARLFAGREHEIQSKKIARHFKKSMNAYKGVVYNKDIISKLRTSILKQKSLNEKKTVIQKLSFKERNLNDYENFETAYHQLMMDLVEQQIFSTNFVIHNSPVKKLFVDGGFSKNSIYMNLLAEAFPDMEVYASSMAQASSLGAALAIHKNWNSKPIPNDLIYLKSYKPETERVGIKINKGKGRKQLNVSTIDL